MSQVLPFVVPCLGTNLCRPMQAFSCAALFCRSSSSTTLSLTFSAVALTLFADHCAYRVDVIWTLLFPGRVSSNRLGRDVGRTYKLHAFALVFLFLLYVSPFCSRVSLSLPDVPSRYSRLYLVYARYTEE